MAEAADGGSPTIRRRSRSRSPPRTGSPAPGRRRGRGHQLRVDGPRGPAGLPPQPRRRSARGLHRRDLRPHGAAARRRGAGRRPLHRDRLDRAHPRRPGPRARSGGPPPEGRRLAAAAGRASPPATPQALQDRTRAEQERISASAFAARAAAEQARWDSEARFRAVFAEAVIGIGVGRHRRDRSSRSTRRCATCSATPPRSCCAANRSGRSSTPTTRRGCGSRSRSCSPGERDHLRVEKAYYRTDGAEIWTDLVLSLIRDPDGAPQYMVAMMENITERHRLQTRLRHQALHDPLTGLPNRTLFFERLDAALARPAAGARRLLPGPRRLQGGQRHPRPRRRRPAAAAPSPGRLRRRGARRRPPGGPDGRRRVRRAGRALDRHDEQLRAVARSALDGRAATRSRSPAARSSCPRASAWCERRRRPPTPPS